MIQANNVTLRVGKKAIFSARFLWIAFLPVTNPPTMTFVPSFLGHMASNLLAIGARYEIIPLPHNVFFHIILAIVFGALASTLFGLQFKLERLK